MALIKTKTIQVYSNSCYKLYVRILDGGLVRHYWELKPFTKPKIVFKVTN